jgi:hypothetical protein
MADRNMHILWGQDARHIGYIAQAIFPSGYGPSKIAQMSNICIKPAGREALASYVLTTIAPTISMLVSSSFMTTMYPPALGVISARAQPP